MDDTATAVASEIDPHDEVAASPSVESDVEEELLVEEVSIDGMCGVY